MATNKWGKYNYSTSTWGTMDSISLWNRPLSLEEMSYLYNYGFGKSYSNPEVDRVIKYYTFECYHDFKNGKLKILNSANVELKNVSQFTFDVVWPMVELSFAKRVLEESSDLTSATYTGRVFAFNKVGQKIEDWVLNKCYFSAANVNFLLDSSKVEVAATIHWSSRDITTY